MPGDFFAEDYNALLFAGVLSGLTAMMVGCFLYHKMKHVRQKKQGGKISTKSSKKLKSFLKRASTASEVNMEAQKHKSNLQQDGCINKAFDRQSIENISGGCCANNGQNSSCKLDSNCQKLPVANEFQGKVNCCSKSCDGCPGKSHLHNQVGKKSSMQSLWQQF